MMLIVKSKGGQSSVQFFPFSCMYENVYNVEKICLPTEATGHFSIKVGPARHPWCRPVLRKGP